MESFSSAFDMTKMEPGPHIPSWRRMATGRTTSTVASLLARELGFPHFSRSSETMSNAMNERMIGRHMLKGRIRDTGSVITNPKVTQIHKIQPYCRKRNEKESIDWIKMDIRKQSRLIVADSVFWEVSKAEVAPDNRKVFTGRFFGLEPDSGRGFKFLGETRSNGKLADFDVCHSTKYTNLTQTNSTYLYWVTESGCLNAYDLLRKRVCASLYLRSTLEGPHKFTDIQFDTHAGKMYVVSSWKGNLKSIFFIRYPPWLIENIVHFKFPVKLELFEASALLINPGSIEILDLQSVDDLCEETSILISDSQGHNTNCDFWPGVYEKVLKEKPEELVKVKAIKSFFGVLDSVWPPLYYARTKDNIKIGSFESMVPLWEFSTTRLSIDAFIPFPDDSPFVLFLTDDDYKLLHLKRVDKDFKTHHEIAMSQPFVLDLPPAEPVEMLPRRPTLRPLRAAATKIQYYMRSAQNCKILGIAHGEASGLIAIFSGNEEDLFVSLYESDTLKFFKRLPAVKVWPVGKRGRKSNGESDDEEASLQDQIEKFVVDFEFEFIFVNIKYRYHSEIFIFRLLNEH